MSNLLFINCDEATSICNKSQYNEASFWQIIKLKLHVFVCKNCGLYVKQNKTITMVCNKHLHRNEHILSCKDKERLQKKIIKRIK